MYTETNYQAYYKKTGKAFESTTMIIIDCQITSFLSSKDQYSCSKVHEKCSESDMQESLAIVIVTAFERERERELHSHVITKLDNNFSWSIMHKFFLYHYSSPKIAKFVFTDCIFPFISHHELRFYIGITHRLLYCICVTHVFLMHPCNSPNNSMH